MCVFQRSAEVLKIDWLIWRTRHSMLNFDLVWDTKLSNALIYAEIKYKRR